MELPSSQKAGAFSRTLQLAEQRFGRNPINIIETGTIRVGADLFSDGGSTRYWKYWSYHTDSKVWTVDISDKNILACKSIIGEHPNINYVVMDSEEFLKEFDKEINILFLDSMDCEPPIEDTWNHQLRECQLALPKLHPLALILMDDYNGIDRITESKSMYSIPFLQENGYVVVYEGDHQILFSKKAIQ